MQYFRDVGPGTVVLVAIGFVFLLLFVPRIRRTSMSAMRPLGKALPLDVVFPPKPIVVRKGIVLKRYDMSYPAWTPSAIHNIRVPQVPHYSFQIECDDALGTDTIIVLVEKNDFNVLAEEGCHVIVTSQQSRLDFGYCHRDVKPA